MGYLMIQIWTTFIKTTIKYKFTIIWIGIICALLLMPSKNIHQTEIKIKHFDKIVHFGLFSILALIITYEAIKNKKKQKLLLTFVYIFIFALSTEILQKIFTSSRQFDHTDILADMLGFILTYLFLKIYTKTKSL